MRGYIHARGLGGAPEDIKKGVEFLQKAGNFDKAKEELLHYKKTLFEPKAPGASHVRFHSAGGSVSTIGSSCRSSSTCSVRQRETSMGSLSSNRS